MPPNIRLKKPKENTKNILNSEVLARRDKLLPEPFDSEARDHIPVNLGNTVSTTSATRHTKRLTNINKHSKLQPIVNTMKKIVFYLTPATVAKELQLNLLTIYKYIRNKQLLAIRFGRNYRIEKKDLDKFIRSNKTY